MAKKHLVIGASGLVGGAIYKELLSQGKDVTGTYYTYPVSGLVNLNMTNKGAIDSLLKDLNPSFIYVPAAYTDVDGCELNPSMSYDLNVLSLLNLITAVKNRCRNAKIVYFSTGYVFDGKRCFYHEDDSANPINVYGTHKLIAEHAIMASGLMYWSIIRLMGVYGIEHQKKNFVYKVLNLPKLRVPDDQVMNFTFAPLVARASIEIAMDNSFSQKIIHVSGARPYSKYDFAVDVCRTFGISEGKITRVSTEELKQTAKRPLVVEFEPKFDMFSSNLCIPTEDCLLNMKEEMYGIRHCVG